MALFSFDRPVTFVAYIFLFTLQMTVVPSEPQTEVLAYGHSGVYCKCIFPQLRGLKISMEYVFSVPLQPSEEDLQGSTFSFFSSTQQPCAPALRPY